MLIVALVTVAFGWPAVCVSMFFIIMIELTFVFVAMPL